ncbi:3-keto-5-aminohexanoate cleavage enzyme [bioreactor metagenome]|uniref:3-keto-5-aminohexanoate cleavage enzyme n=1 Tax=bioreactor metagenome TaxID=1076179 RepID=A0A645AR86_9ZZZZ
MAIDPKYLMESYANPIDYWELFSKSGLSKFPPCVVSVAITGGNQGKESNPNLPETLDEQVQQTYDAYKEGASLVHIHCRCPHDPSTVTDDPEVYRELNRRIRKKCPDIIINNTVIGGKWSRNGVMCPPMNVSIPARPEVGSVDITNYTWSMMRKGRPEYGRPQDTLEEMQYTINKQELEHTLSEMKKYGVKPEFELFDIGDLQYLRDLIQEGKTDPNVPNWVQMVFTPALTYQTPDMLLAAIRHMPKNTVLGIVATGGCQYPFLALALILGCNVRVGMEDGYYVEKGVLAESNAQLVAKIVRIAKELGRPIATPAQAREILGLGAPRMEF